MSVTRIERPRPEGPRVLGFAERVSFFISALHKATADDLLSGLAEPLRRRAKTFALAMTGWDSARRQARLAHEFGAHQDVGHHIHRLVVEAQGKLLRSAIVAASPPAVRKEFPQFQGGGESFPLAVRAVAARLVKEVVRVG
jgi:hypothetical protein